MIRVYELTQADVLDAIVAFVRERNPEFPAERTTESEGNKLTARKIEIRGRRTDGDWNERDTLLNVDRVLVCEVTDEDLADKARNVPF